LSRHAGSDAPWRRERRNRWLAEASKRPIEELMASADKQVVREESCG
jgi:hypothetical protein